MLDRLRQATHCSFRPSRGLWDGCWEKDSSLFRWVRSASARDGGTDGGEGVVGVLAEGGDGADADHDDQGQHDRVLDRRRAVFALQETHDRLLQATHYNLLSSHDSRKQSEERSSEIQFPS